jgi:hypothetical protein
MIVIAVLLGLLPPATAVVIWVRMWRGSRKRRLWFAGLAPVGSAAFVLLGLALWAAGNIVDRQPASGCSSQVTYCPTGSMPGIRPDSPISTFGLWIAATALATLLVSLVLATVTAIVEATRASRLRAR